MLKRTLSLLLVLALLCVSGAMLTSCGAALSVEEVEKNPSAALTQALANNELFADEAGLEAALKTAMNAGAVEIDWDASALGDFYPDVKATLYLDRAEKKAVLDAVLEGDLFGEEPSASRVYLSGQTLMLQSPLLLGSDRTLALNRATVEEKLADSALADLFEMDEEDASEAIKALEGIWEMLEEGFASASEESAEKADEFINGMLACLSQSVSEGKTKNADGKDVDCVILSYKVNDETLAAISNYMMGIEPRDEEGATDADDEERAGVDLVLNVRIEASTGALVSIGVSGEIRYEDVIYGEDYVGTPMLTSAEGDDVVIDEEFLLDDEIFVGGDDGEDDWLDEDFTLGDDWLGEDFTLGDDWLGEDFTLGDDWLDEDFTLGDDWLDEDFTLGDDWLDEDFTLGDDWLDGEFGDGFFGETVIVTSEISAEAIFGEKEMRITTSGKDGEETFESSMTLVKAVNGSVVSYTVTGETDGQSTLNASLSYNKESGEFVLAYKTYEDGEEDETLEIKGTLKTDTAGTVLSVDTYKMGAVTVELRLKLSFIKEAEMPEFPTDATDLLTMTEEELATLTEELQNGLLGMLMMGFGV